MVFSSLASKPVATVFSGFVLKTGGDGFSRFGLKTGGDRLPHFGLRTDKNGLVIWASKSPHWFLGLGLKTKRATVCRLRHRTDGRMKTAWGTHQDLVAGFIWKQVGIGFSSLASRLVEVRQRLVHVASSRRSRDEQVEDGRVNATDYVRPCYPYLSFLMY
jgi:hypothetical protein